MTTIAYKAGVLAADTLIAHDSGYPVGRLQKIRKAADGCLVGASGVAWRAKQFLDWKAGDGPEPDATDDSFQGIVVHPDGRITVYDNQNHSFDCEAEIFSIGSGSPEARGAMAAGASAERAIEICATLDLHTGLPATVIRFDGAS